MQRDSLFFLFEDNNVYTMNIIRNSYSEAV